MPTFCRHNRFVQNCTICQRELEPDKPARSGGGSRPGGATRRPTGRTASSNTRALRVRREVRATDDGFRNDLVPGIKASADVRRLAEELAFAAARLAELAASPPGAYATVAAEPDREQALWVAVLIAYLSPAEGDAPFSAIDAAITPWGADELPVLGGAARGPRSSHEDRHGDRTLAAYRAWAGRVGSQQAGLHGEDAWTPERRFARAYERLGTLPGLTRAARFDTLASLGRLGLLDVRAEALHVEDDATAIAAKRVFGIGDRFLLEKRAAELVAAVDLPLEALDLALFNWGAGPDGRATMGSRVEVDGDAVERIAAELGV